MVEFKRIQLEKGIRQVGPDRWEIQVRIGREPATGKLRQVSRTTPKGIADARRLRVWLIPEVSRAMGEHGGTGRTVPHADQGRHRPVVSRGTPYVLDSRGKTPGQRWSEQIRSPE
jgi:hypothetical protein